MKRVLIILLFFISMPAFANFREVSGFEAEEDFSIKPSELKSSTIETINTVKDSNKKLYGVVNKSQIINFDENIERVSITNDNIAQVVVLSPKQIMLNGKQPGSTSIIFWSENSDTPSFYNLIIRKNTDSFIQAVEYIAPNENISIIFNDTGAVLTGKVSSAAVKEKILNLAEAYDIHLTNMTEAPSKQVLLEVKVTEASKNFARDLGLNMVAGRHVNLEGFKAGDYIANSNANAGSTTLFQTGEKFVFGYLKGGKLGVDFEASEAKGDVKILAEPKLLSVDGQEGSFTVGNQVPVPSEMGNYGNVSYSYKDTGVVLRFTPTIMEKTNRVRLKLSPEVSEVDNSVSVAGAGGTSVYGFKTRKVETTVELRDGETLVIAGLIQNSSSRSRTQVPILGNIPVIGSLFSTTNDKKNEGELIIFITPKIVDNSKSVESL